MEMTTPSYSKPNVRGMAPFTSIRQTNVNHQDCPVMARFESSRPRIFREGAKVAM